MDLTSFSNVMFEIIYFIDWICATNYYIIYIIKSKPCLLVTEQYCQLLIVKCCNWVQYSLHTRHYSGAALREAPLCAVNSFACIQRRPRHAKDIVKFLTNN